MKIALILTILNSLNLYAHGENMAGPHGGFIRMPGAYHVEVLPKSESLYHVYLMNVGNKDPKTDQSFVLFNYRLDKKIVNFICLPKTEYFECSTKDKLDFKKGELVLKTKRGETIGDEAIYSLPLELKK